MRGILIVITVSTMATVAHAGAGDAKTHWEEGTKLYDLGRYKEAAHEYEEAFRLKPDPAFLFNIGQAYRQAGDDEAALRAYRGFLRRFPDYEKRSEVEGYIRQLQQRIDDKRKAEELQQQQRQQQEKQAQEEREREQRQREERERAQAPASVAAPVVAASPSPPREHVPAYKKWWLWTVVGVVVVGGGAAAVAIALTTPKNAPSPAGTMTLVFP